MGLLRKLTASAGVLAFGGIALGSGLDRISGPFPQVERLVPTPFRAQADRSASVLAVVDGDYGAALESSRKAVVADPVDPDSTALLGTALLLAEDDETADKAFRVAARFGWRNPATQLYWYEAALQTGTIDVAVQRADAILRVSPSYAQFDAILEPLETDPAARAVLIEHAALRPSWLQRYLRPMRDVEPEVLDRRAVLLSELGERGDPLGCEDTVRLTDALLRNGARALAERFWNANCPEEKISDGVSDLEFDLAGKPEGSPFGWEVRRTGDVSVRSQMDGADRSLLIVNRSSTPKLVLLQAVNLPPGSYRATVSGGDANQGASNGKLAITIGCRGKSVFPSQQAYITAGGTSLSVQDCDRQILTIWVQPTTAATRLSSLSLAPEG